MWPSFKNWLRTRSSSQLPAALLSGLVAAGLGNFIHGDAFDDWEAVDDEALDEMRGGMRVGNLDIDIGVDYTIEVNGQEVVRTTFSTKDVAKATKWLDESGKNPIQVAAKEKSKEIKAEIKDAKADSTPKPDKHNGPKVDVPAVPTTVVRVTGGDQNGAASPAQAVQTVQVSPDVTVSGDLDSAPKTNRTFTISRAPEVTQVAVTPPAPPTVTPPSAPHITMPTPPVVQPVIQPKMARIEVPMPGAANGNPNQPVPTITISIPVGLPDVESAPASAPVAETSVADAVQNATQNAVNDAIRRAQPTVVANAQAMDQAQSNTDAMRTIRSVSQALDTAANRVRASTQSVPAQTATVGSVRKVLGQRIVRLENPISGGAKIIQAGAGNTIGPDLNGILGLVTVIQNSMDNQAIRSMTTMNVEVRNFRRPTFSNLGRVMNDVGVVLR